MPALKELTTSPLPATMSEEAHDLMNCFDARMTDIVRRFAERIAAQERSYIILDGEQFLDVDKQHVMQAGQAIFDALARMSEMGQLPPELASFDLAKQCFDSKCP